MALTPLPLQAVTSLRCTRHNMRVTCPILLRMMLPMPRPSPLPNAFAFEANLVRHWPTPLPTL
eukprot:5864661-Amphidinium_carterae.2